jgi:SAM-dependent methyltransferase
MTDETDGGRGPWDGLLAPDRVPTEIDTTRAHPARIYDAWLGGKNNFAPDREMADQIAAINPEVPVNARANRAFLGRAVRFAVESGIRQFLDIGTGIPTAGNTHEVAQAIDPECSVAYVDNDPMVLAHSRALMAAAGRGRTSVIQGDLRDPAAILSHPEVRAAVDLARPVALLLVAVLHFLGDEDKPEEIIATLRDALAPGSVLVLSHGVYSEDAQDVADEIATAYNRGAANVHVRSPSRVVEFFDGFDLLDPGFVLVSDWRPDADTVPLTRVGSGIGSGLGGGVGVLTAR